MPELISDADARRDLVIANRLLALEGIIDTYGHISVRDPRDPERFLLAWARAPELVEEADLLEFGLDGELRQQTDRHPYTERYIHAAIYKARPEVMSVCHNHTPSILPFSISKTARLRAVIHTAAVIGSDIPVWDIADEFGSETNMLVSNMAQGRSLARTLGQRRVALMRGHGSVVAGVSIQSAVAACLNMDKNARVQLQAMQLGDYVPLSAGEIARPSVAPGEAATPYRAWEAFVRRVTDRA
jgi:HCOMODA/2-hydroxy-3-carboxy-muconic semialdehyde decarboxylase